MKNELTDHLHHRPHHHHKIGEELIGRPDNTLRNFLTDPEEFELVIKKIINEGPPPKQIRKAILLKELSKLVKVVSATTGRLPEPIDGIEIESDDLEDDNYIYPVRLPEQAIADIIDKNELVEWIEEGPPHDVICDILVVSVIRWIEEAINSNTKSNSHEK